jgi:uncharacterized protein YdhG (YjbR/CyaY superfamily)
MPPGDVNAYLASVPPDARSALTKLRKDIRAAAPDAEERIGWGMPMYMHQGMLVAFAAAKNHCSFFVMHPAVMVKHGAALKGYDTAKGTVRFSPTKPLPATLVRALVKACLAENAATAAARAKKKAAKTKTAKKRSAARKTAVKKPAMTK